MTQALPENVRVLSSLPEDHTGFDVSDERFLKALASAEERHFWFRARNELITARLTALGIGPGARIIELGCGGGAVSAHLSQVGYRVTGVDGHVSLVARAARRAPSASFVVHDLSHGVGPLGDERYAAAGLFDVIEHLDDPAAALASALDCLTPDGVVVGTVPALMSLWSQVDVQAGHRLRYDHSSLRALLTQVRGAQLIELSAFNRLLVPMLWLQRRMVVKRDAASTSEQNLKVPPRPVNGALLGALRLETRLSPTLDAAPLPGASLWFALRKTSLPFVCSARCKDRVTRPSNSILYTTPPNGILYKVGERRFALWISPRPRVLEVARPLLSEDGYLSRVARGAVPA